MVLRGGSLPFETNIMPQEDKNIGVSIYPIQLGFDYCYIIQDKGTIMIDGGAPGKIKAFMKGIGKLSIRPEQIKLIVLTHGHWDHIASVKDIKEKTGAKIDGLVKSH